MLVRKKAWIRLDDWNNPVPYTLVIQEVKPGTNAGIWLDITNCLSQCCVTTTTSTTTTI